MTLTSSGPTGASYKRYEVLSRKEIAHNLRRNIPKEVRDLNAFVVFKFAPSRTPGGKRSKLPFYVVDHKIRSGEHGTDQDRTHLVSFAEATRLFETDNRFAGIGVCALKENPVFFIDIDNCIDVATGEVSSLAHDLLRWDTYTEISPSGHGLRMVLSGNPQINTKNNKIGLELFSTKGFVTLTGMPFGHSTTIKSLTSKRLQHLQTLLQPDHTPAQDIVSIPSPLTGQRYRDAKQALAKLDPDCGYDEWLRVGQALHSGDQSPEGRGFQLWLEWSQQGDKFAQTNEKLMLRKWQGFKGGGGITLSSLFAMSNAVEKPKKAKKVKLPKELAEGIDIETYTPDNVPETVTHPLADGLFDHYGAYMFIGRAKIGKSRILGAIVAAALCGGDALGFKFKHKCKVLALSLEEDPSSLMDRVRTYAVEPTEHNRQLHIIDDRLALEAAKKYSDDMDWTEWLDHMLARKKPDLVYIDTAIKMRMLWRNDPAYRSKNVTEQDYQNASLLDEAARKHKCVIVSTIHGSKRKSLPQHGFDPFESIGTTSWTLAGCIGALVLMDKPGTTPLEDEDDGQRVFSVRGRYMPRGDAHYLVQSNSNGTFSNLGEYLHVIASVQTQEYLHFILESQNHGAEHVTARIIASNFSRSERAVRVRLRKFSESGQSYEGYRLDGVQGQGYRLVRVNGRNGRS